MPDQTTLLKKRMVDNMRAQGMTQVQIEQALDALDAQEEQQRGAQLTDSERRVLDFKDQTASGLVLAPARGTRGDR